MDVFINWLFGMGTSIQRIGHDKAKFKNLSLLFASLVVKHTNYKNEVNKIIENIKNNMIVKLTKEMNDEFLIILLHVNINQKI